MRYFTHIIILFVFSFLVIYCNKGIEPEPEPEIKQEGFGGKVFFIGNWDENVTRTHIIVFKDPSVGFTILNLAYVSLNIPFGVSEYTYSTLDSAYFPPNTKLQAGTYAFIAVAQQITEEISFNSDDWLIRGLYFAPGNNTIPGSVTIAPGEYRDSINIYCILNSPSLKPTW
jgi:hypothetical protein